MHKDKPNGQIRSISDSCVATRDANVSLEFFCLWQLKEKIFYKEEMKQFYLMKSKKDTIALHNLNLTNLSRRMKALNIPLKWYLNLKDLF